MVIKGENKSVDTEVNLLLSNDSSIKELNRKFLGNDKVTDVLSFPSELVFIPLLGDIIIDTEVADAQKGINSLKDEVLYLFLHGLLHLLGYDHLSKAMADVMFEKQKYYWNLYKR